jgi:hypothetical protein
MNAVMHKYGMTEGQDMPVDENDNVALQVAELRADARHIQADVTDNKAGQAGHPSTARVGQKRDRSGVR